MPSIFDQFPSQAPVDVAGTPFQDQPSAVSKLLFGKPEGPDVRDPQKMAPARYIVAGGKTLDPAQDSAWDDATASPRAKRVREIMGSEPMKRLMDLANFIGPGPKMPMRAMAPEGPKGIRAYHGSPHDFDRFDISRIGTGEGAQAYGRGHYFAESEKTARYYRDTLTQNFKGDGTKTSHWLGYAMGQSGQDAPRALEILRNRVAAYDAGKRPFGVADKDAAYRADLEAAIKEGEKGLNSGRMYEVNIKADPADFLDWDVPLSKQPERVKQALARIPEGMMPGGQSETALAAVRRNDYRMLPDEGIDRLMKNVGTEIAPFRDAGIPGIRYKDAGSRGAEGGTSNYVVFSDDLIDIIRKYGLAGLLAGGGALSQGGGGNGDAY